MGHIGTRNHLNRDDLTVSAQHPTIFPGINHLLMSSAPTKERGNLSRSWGQAPLLLAILALSLIAADTPTTVGTADEQRFLTDIKSLTAPAMEGRGDGAKGLTRAAHLIEQRYKSLGLQPAGKNGFFQPFDVITGRHLRSGNRLQEAPRLEDVSADRRNYKLLEEFIPLSFSANGSEDVLPRFGDAEGPEDAGILCLQVKNSTADNWLRNQGMTLSEVQTETGGALHAAGSLSSTSTRLILSLTVDIERIHATVNNVLAYLPGKTGEYVILGAHYDHLGRGEAHSMAPSQIGQIHPGADDNASGTARVLELARLFAPLKGQLQRG